MSLVPYNPAIGDILIIASGARYQFDGSTFFYLDGGVAGDPATLNYNLPVDLATVLLDYTKVATQAEVDAGAVNDKAVTPLTLKSETNRVIGLIPSDSYYDARYLGKLERANNSLLFNGKTEAQILATMAAHVHPDATTTVAGFMSSADKVKLDAVDLSLIGGATDAFLLDRANHTGTQATSTITGLDAALLSKAPLASPTFTGIPTAPTAAASTSTTQIATTAFVQGLLTNHTHAQTDIVGLVSDLALKAPLASPALTGTPTAPTATANTNTTQVATTAYVQTEISDLIDGAPTTLDTLNELAAAINDDPNYSTTVNTALALKADLASPTFTGTPAAPTATGGTNTTQLATTAFVQQEVASLIAGAPGVLDTLDELAAAIGDDANFATTMANSLALKADLASPSLTGTPLAPTATGGTNTTQIATTAFVQQELSTYSAPLSHTHPISEVVGLTAALNLKADLASPALTGTPTAPTATAGTNTTQLATTAFVQAGITALVAGAPTTLDTLNELAAAINDDPNYSTTVNTALGLKANIASPTFTGVPAAPTATGGTNTTQLATTAFVQQELSTYAAPLVHTHAMTDVTGLTAALALKADLASPALTGTPTAPTATANTNTTQIATTAYVQTEITDLIAGAPVGLDTLDELAAAINDDPNYSTTVTNALNLKANLASPTFTGVPAAPTAATTTNTTQLATTAFVQQELTANPVGITGVKEIKTANYTITAADRGKILIGNSATAITFTFPTSASLGATWVVSILNIGVGNVVLQPAAGDTVDGEATVNVVTDSSRLITSDGATTLRSVFTGGGNEVAVRTEYTYVATAGQTTFTGNDVNGNALAYTAGSLNVHVNGVLQRSVVEYAATNGTSVVLTTGAALNDVVTIEAYNIIQISDVYSKSETDTLLAGKLDVAGGNLVGNLAVGGILTTYGGTGPELTRWEVATDADINGLTGGSTFGSLIKGRNSGHLTMALQDNDINDTFSVISGGGNYTVDNVYDTQCLRVNAQGFVTAPNQPAFFSVSNAIPAATTGSFQAGSNDGASPDVIMNVGNHYDVTNGRFTAPVNGFYFFSMSVTSTGLTTHNILFRFYVNGVANGLPHLNYLQPWFSTSIQSMIYLNSGDYVDGGLIYANNVLSEIFNSTFSGFLQS